VRKATLVLGAAVILMMAGCGDDGRPGVTFDPTSCPDSIEVNDVAGIVAALEAVPWDRVGPYSSGSEPPSGDLIVVGTIVLEAADVPLPEECLARDDCRHLATFSATDLTGAVVEGDGNLFEGETRLILADTTVRLSLSLMDTHPGPFNFVPLITVLGPCGEPCDAGQLACPGDGSCYGSFDTFCRRCEGRTAAECACRTLDGPVEDGEYCDFFMSGDVIQAGVCRSGVCVGDE
jgi:hypothetical protein